MPRKDPSKRPPLPGVNDIVLKMFFAFVVRAIGRVNTAVASILRLTENFLPLYFICYEAPKEDAGRQRVRSSLEAMGARGVMHSVWALQKGDISAQTLRDRMKPLMSPEARLTIVEASDWVGVNLLASPHDAIDRDVEMHHRRAY